jgi:hypothetical protein
MEKKIIISKRFLYNTKHVYQYLQKQFSTHTADIFLERLKKRIDFIANNPEVAKCR